MADFKIDLNLEPSIKVREALPEGGLDRDQMADYIKVALMERAGMPKTWAIKVLEEELRPEEGQWDLWVGFEALDEDGTLGFAGQAVIEGRDDIIDGVVVYHLIPPGKVAGLAGRIAAVRRDLWASKRQEEA